jgi:hypothetical protein
MPKPRRNADGPIGPDRLLEEISHAAFFDPLELFNEDGTLKDLRDVPEGARRAIAQFKVAEFSDRESGRKGVMKEVKLVSKGGALTLAGRRLKELELGGGPSGARLDLSRLTEEDPARLLALLEKAAV